MKTSDTKSLTPSAAGLTLAVLSGPRGSVQNNWPCIEYTVQMSDNRGRVVWTGEYRLGVGHVKVPAAINASLGFSTNAEQQSLLRTWANKPHAQFINKQLWADVAAILAKKQLVKPALNDVCHSLLSDGAAFFDGQRFEEWAGDMGYSDDSIKARDTFEACDKIGRDLARALSRD